LVMVRISGFGQDGPYRDRPGYGVIGEALSGLRYITGDADRPPSRVAVSMTDYITGLYAAFGATLALLVRERTGRGQVVDAALYETAFTFMEPWIPAFEKLGHVAGRSGSRLPESTPNNLYPTADDDFIHITAPSNTVFGRLAGVMGRPDLTSDPHYAHPVDRSTHHEDLDALIAAWTRQHHLADLERVLTEAEVPASRIFSIADIFGDPHYTARGSIAHAPDDELGTIAMATVVPRLSDTPGAIRHAGRRVGADTRRVLEETFGMAADRIESLVGDGVVVDDRDAR
jgi:crotonobetainyl-CoA:carnitine CoA-transferase CaiB-like acyl-CoA transferase